MSRKKRAILAQETVEIVDRGWYLTEQGERVDISDTVAACLSSTTLFTPAELKELVQQHMIQSKQLPRKTAFEVNNETTLSAARRVVDQHRDRKTLCLNFASAKNPGGGFLGGSQAQEESLARSSALYASLIAQPDYYEANRCCGTAIYTNHMILSPNVPIFRDDHDALMIRPYAVSILTSPAVNAGVIRANQRDNEQQLRPAMFERIASVLAVAAHRGYEQLVLGAWGCGVFRNDPTEIATLFADALLKGGQFSNHFTTVVFAVLDSTTDSRIITPFKKIFSA